MQDYEISFRHWLESHQLKLTKERRFILETVFGWHEHFDADALYEQIRKVNRNISRATVYRTIHLLVEAGLIQKSVRDEKRDRYEHIYGHPRHVHWICNSCGSVLESDLTAITRLLEEKARIDGFTLADINVAVKGICWKCSNNENKSQ